MENIEDARYRVAESRMSSSRGRLDEAIVSCSKSRPAIQPPSRVTTAVRDVYPGDCKRPVVSIYSTRHELACFVTMLPMFVGSFDV